MTNRSLLFTENSPAVWQKLLPWPTAESHKYSRGQVLVQGGSLGHTGAAKLVARAALRIGAGAVTVLCDQTSLPVYATSFQAIMTQDQSILGDLLNDHKVSAYAIGPGASVDEHTKQRVLVGLKSAKPMVLDADAITVFKDNPSELFSALHSKAILTPHEGEFARLFPELKDGRLTKAVSAARKMNAIIVLKGAETVIAAPDGRRVANRTSSPFLATAGSGDVLTGIIAGLLAGKMPVFEAACAGVWLHGKAAQDFGAGLIAEDIPELLPSLLQSLYKKADL